MKKTSCKRGFTLIELLVVVLIIGILAAVAVPQYQKAVWKAETVRIKTILDAVDKAQQVYFTANGSYATDISQLDIDLPVGEKAESGDILYSHFYCYPNASVSFKCTFDAGHPLFSLSIERYFKQLTVYDNAKTLCWAKKTKSEQQQFCQVLGGVQREHNSKTYTLYTLD